MRDADAYYPLGALTGWHRPPRRRRVWTMLGALSVWMPTIMGLLFLAMQARWQGQQDGLMARSLCASLLWSIDDAVAYEYEPSTTPPTCRLLMRDASEQRYAWEGHTWQQAGRPSALHRTQESRGRKTWL